MSRETLTSNDEQHEAIPVSDIMAERSLFAILVKSFKLPKSKFNLIAAGSFSIVLAFYTFASSRNSTEFIQDIRSLANLSFGFSTSILGFLIAGLAIFSAVNDLSLFTYMARKWHSSGVSYLKYNFITLTYVFAVYLGLCILCFFIIALGQTNGPLALGLSLVATLIPSINYIYLKTIIVKLCSVILTTWLFYAILLLKTFIFNIYHLVMTTVRWQAQNERNLQLSSYVYSGKVIQIITSNSSPIPMLEASELVKTRSLFLYQKKENEGSLSTEEEIELRNYKKIFDCIKFVNELMIRG